MLGHSWPTFSLFLPVQSSLFTLPWAEFFISSSGQNAKGMSIVSEWPSHIPKLASIKGCRLRSKSMWFAKKVACWQMFPADGELQLLASYLFPCKFSNQIFNFSTIIFQFFNNYFSNFQQLFFKFSTIIFQIFNNYFSITLYCFIGVFLLNCWSSWKNFGIFSKTCQFRLDFWE